MRNVNELFAPDMLNVGKILAIKKGHGLSTLEIKKTINAKKIKKFKAENKYSLEHFIIEKIHLSTYALDEDSVEEYDVYQVTGDDVASSFLRMKISSNCFSLNFNSSNLKKLHNAQITKDKIDKAKAYIFNGKEAHDELVNALVSQKLKTKMAQKTKLFQKIIDGYGDEELVFSMENIKEAMKSVW